MEKLHLKRTQASPLSVRMDPHSLAEAWHWKWLPDMCEQPTDIDYAGGLKKRQKVFEFDMATWRVRNPLRRVGPFDKPAYFSESN